MKSGGLAAFARDLFKDFGDDDALGLSAAVAFYTALSFAPLVLLLVTVGGLLGEGGKNELLGTFSAQLGPKAAQVTESVVEAAASETDRETKWWHTVLSSVGLLTTASAVFAQLQAALNRVFDVAAKPTGVIRKRRRVLQFAVSIWSWLRKRLISMGMVLVVLFILLVSLVISSLMESFVPGGGGEEFSARAIEFVVSVLVATLLFAAVFKVLPDANIPWRQVWLGALVTSVLFNLGKLALGLYIDKGGVGKNYGEAVGGLIALLVWVYYSCLALLLGAEITQRLGRPRDANH